MQYRGTLLILILLILLGSYSAFGEPIDFIGNATILFSDGRSGSITYNAVMKTSTMHLNDGQSATTTYNEIAKTTHTVYSNGTTATSSFLDITQTSHTVFSNGLTANTLFNDITNTLHTTFSDGTTATTSYNEVTNTATTTVFGIFLLPSMAKIHFSPKSTKIEKILHIKDLKSGEREAEGWIRNEILEPTAVPSKTVD